MALWSFADIRSEDRAWTSFADNATPETVLALVVLIFRSTRLFCSMYVLRCPRIKMHAKQSFGFSCHIRARFNRSPARLDSCKPFPAHSISGSLYRRMQAIPVFVVFYRKCEVSHPECISDRLRDGTTSADLAFYNRCVQGREFQFQWPQAKYALATATIHCAVLAGPEG